MARSNKTDLDVWVPGQEDSTYSWALNPPPGHDSFRIVVHCRKAPAAHSYEPRARSNYIRGLAQVLIPLFAFWRTGR